MIKSIVNDVADFCTKYSDTRLTTIHQTLGSKITSTRARRNTVRKDFI